MKWLVILYISILIASNSIAQDSSLASQAMRKIYIEPVSLIDYLNGPSVRLGAELPLSHVFSAFVTGGLYGLNGSGYYLKGGIERYLATDKMKGYFIDASIFYKKKRTLRLII